MPFLILAAVAVALARAGYPALGQSPFLPQQPADNTGQGTPPAGGAGNPPATDWAPPTEPSLGPAQNIETQVQTDGTDQAPGIDWRPAAEQPDAVDAATAAAAMAPRVELGGPGTPKWKVITYVSQKTTVDDNIYISNSNKQSDVYFSVSPGVAAGWGDFRSVLLQNSSRFADEYGQTREPVNDPLNGDYAFANYTATATHFVSHDSADAIDQDAAMSAQWNFTKLLMGMTARFQSLSGPDIDVGTRTRRDLYTLEATAKYSVSDKTSFEFEAGGVDRQYVTELSSSDWHAQLYMDYQLAPKTSLGAGVVAGVRTLQTSPDQYYQQGQLRATYNATAKLSVHGNGGLEVGRV